MKLFSTPSVNKPYIWQDMKIGLLGGSFNPAHYGHVHISRKAIERLNLDAVWWMVTPQNPLKSTDDMASIEDRIESANLATKSDNRIIVTDIENHIDTRYTADTLKELSYLFPKTNFVWLMGADNLHQVHKWNEWKDIFNIMPIAVLNRPPYGQASRKSVAGEVFKKNRLRENQAFKLALSQAPSWVLLDIPLANISATEIRNKK